jgi:hypothetical protein
VRDREVHHPSQKAASDVARKAVRLPKAFDISPQDIRHDVETRASHLPMTLLGGLGPMRALSMVSGRAHAVGIS